MKNEKKKTLTLGSLFSGSGGFELAGMLAGIIPVWASEIEPFPIRVTTKRMPFLNHYGDVSKMNGADVEPVDIITFGSPCTDLSVAGKRAGLEGHQSSLFYQAIRIIEEMRCATNGEYPKYIVWENVPGAFSSNKGRDFKAVLEAVIGVACPGTEVPAPEKERWPYADLYMGEGWSVAYRTLDAQYWGVPQRRKRIFLVADFAGGSAGKVLFESEGMSGYSAESFRAWQRAAGNPAPCPGTPGCLVLNDQGGRRMDTSRDVVSTLRAEAHHPPCVLEAAGFCTEHSAQSRGIGYGEETAPTLRAGGIPATVALENHPTDSRVKLSSDQKVQTLTSRMGTGGGNIPLVMEKSEEPSMFENHSQDTRYRGPLETAPTVSSTYGTGGNNQPFVVEKPKTLKIRSGCSGGGKGPLIQEDKSATLSCNNDQTVFVPFCKGSRPHSNDEAQSWKNGKVANTLNTFDTGESRCNELVVQAYGICSDKSHAMLSGNPHSGIYEAETSRTLDANGGNPGCNQGGIAVVAVQGSVIGREDKNGPQGSGVGEDISFTLNTADKHAVAYPVYCTSKNSFFTRVEKELADTLVATGYKDPPVVNDRELEYIVRRLTPTECARLQGFPDWWCAGLETEEPTEEEISFWRKVFETHREILGTSSKPKSDRQIIKWLKQPHSDSAEYKMWGNGIALPCVYFVLSGIVWAYSENEK